MTINGLSFSLSMKGLKVEMHQNPAVFLKANIQFDTGFYDICK